MLLAVAAVAVVLIGVRVALPTVIQDYVNDKLDESPSYDGSVGDIDLSLIRGAYRIDDIAIIKTEGDVPVPLFAAEHVEFSVLWSALLKGAVVAEAEVSRAAVNIVDGASEESRQTGTDGQWLTLLDELVPLRIDRVEVRDSELHFRNFESDPVVDVFLSRINGVASNLSNSEDLTETMVATVNATALAMEDSEVTLMVSFDPTPVEPTFDLDLRLLGLPIVSLDSVIDAYAPFDVEGGTLDVVAEMAAADGRLEGYVKPIIHNLDVFKWQEDVERDGDNPLVVVWESFVGFIGEILQNQPTGQLATNVPISGDLDSPDTSVLVAVANILRNAFIEAFQANFENTVTLDFEADEAADDAVDESVESADSEQEAQ